MTPSRFFIFLVLNLVSLLFYTPFCRRGSQLSRFVKWLIGQKHLDHAVQPHLL